MEVNQEPLSAQVAVKQEPLSEDDESGNKSDMSDISKKPRQHLVLNALYGGACCCVCLCVDGAPDMQDNLNVRLRLGPGRAGSLHHMLEAVLRDKVLDLPETNFLCEKCTDATIRAYIFIQNAKDTADTLARQIADLHGQVDHALDGLNRGCDVEKIILSTNHPKVKIEPKTEVSKNNVPQVNDQSDVTLNWEKEENTEESSRPPRPPQPLRGAALTRRGGCGLCVPPPPPPPPSHPVASGSSPARARGPRAECAHTRYLRWWRERRSAAGKRWLGVQCPDCPYQTRNKLTYLAHVSVHLRAPSTPNHSHQQGNDPQHSHQQGDDPQHSHQQGDDPQHSHQQWDDPQHQMHVPLGRQTKTCDIAPRPAICKTCRKIFITATDFLKHRKDCEANHETFMRTAVLCHICGARVPRLHKHLNSHALRNCEVCGEEVIKARFKRHKRKHQVYWNEIPEVMRKRD